MGGGSVGTGSGMGAFVTQAHLGQLLVPVLVNVNVSPGFVHGVHDGITHCVVNLPPFVGDAVGNAVDDVGRQVQRPHPLIVVIVKISVDGQR